MFKYILLLLIFTPSVVFSQIDSTRLFEKSNENEQVKSKKEYIQSTQSETEQPTSEQKQLSSAALKIQFTAIKNQASRQRKQRNPSPEQQLQMDRVVSDLKKIAPESFDFHFCKYLSGNHKVEWVNHLKKAETIQPNNPDVHVQLAAYYIIKKDKQKSLDYLKKLIANNRLTKASIDYATDLLLSVPESGTLITHGFEDTYATIYLQFKNNFRNDVQIISLDLLQSEEYAKNIKSQGYIIPEVSTINASYLESFCRNNARESIALSLTLPKEYFYPIQSNLFVVGLTFQYNPRDAWRQFEINEELWFKTLTKKIIQESIVGKTNMLSANYLPMLIYLRNVHKKNNDYSFVNELNKSIEQIAEQSKTVEKVKKIDY